MKKLYLLAFLVMSAFIFTACGPDTIDQPQPPATLELDLQFITGDVTHNSAMVEITPSDNETAYYWSAMPEEKYDSFADANALKNEDMEYFKSLAEEEAVSVATIIDRETSLGVLRETLSELTPATAYVVYGYALTPEGYTGQVSEVRFETEEGVDVPPGIPEARVKVEVAQMRMTQCDANFTPDNMDVMFFPYVITDEVYQNYGGDRQGVVDHFVETLEYSAALNGVSVSDMASLIRKRGNYSETFRYLVPETTNWLYVVELDMDGKVIGLTCQSVETTPREMVDTTFRIEIPQVGQTYASVAIYPSDLEQTYFAEVFERGEFERLGGASEEFMEHIVSSAGANITGRLYSGERSGLFDGLPSGVDFVLAVFACDETYLSEVFVAEFATPAIIDPKDMTIDIEVTSLEPTLLKAIFTPNDNMVGYHFSFMTEEFYNQYASDVEAVQAGFDHYIQLWFDDYEKKYPGEWTREEIIAGRQVRGQEPYTESKMVPETTYYIWAGSFSPAGVLLSVPSLEKITTPEYVESDATAQPVVPYYWNAEAVLGSFYKGQVAIVYDEVITANTDTWYTGFFTGDYSSEEAYPDYWIASRLFEIGDKNICADGEKDIRFVNALGNYTLLGIAVDENGVFGEPYRQLINVNYMGFASPDLFPPDFDDMKMFAPTPNMMAGMSLNDAPYGVDDSRAVSLPVAVRQSAAAANASSFRMTLDGASFAPATTESATTWRTPSERRKSDRARFAYRIR